MVLDTHVGLSVDAGDGGCVSSSRTIGVSVAGIEFRYSTVWCPLIAKAVVFVKRIGSTNRNSHAVHFLFHADERQSVDDHVGARSPQAMARPVAQEHWIFHPDDEDGRSRVPATFR